MRGHQPAGRRRFAQKTDTNARRFPATIVITMSICRTQGVRLEPCWASNAAGYLTRLFVMLEHNVH